MLPIAPPPDTNDRRMVFVRFLDHWTEMGGQNRKFFPEEIVRMELGTARALVEWRRFGDTPESWPASAEFASEAEFNFQETLMLEVAKNEQVTAQDALSQELDRKFNYEDAGPKLIVRFIRPGTFGNASCGTGSVWPVSKEHALRMLRCKVPVVELATPGGTETGPGSRGSD